ncbi:MAG: aldo/keto reductase [Alphaproteobacteria bacterium]|nr:aldo/keto reductase [Alphaproteobacteria bacterium]
MEQRRLGKSGPAVGVIGMGCMAMAGWYGARDDSEARRAIDRAIDLGVTMFDTADLYGGGDNERFVGSIIKPRRGEVFFTTKWGHIWDDRGWPAGVNGTPERCAQACDDSLKRLGFDHIDLYYLHRVDPAVPIEESIGAMKRLVEQGKVRYIGVSEVNPRTLKRAHAVHPVTALQTEYSLWSREPEGEIFKACADLGIGFVAYSPLGRGILTGAIKKASDINATDIRGVLPRYQGENVQKNQRILAEVKKLADEKHCTLPQLALAWIITKQKGVVPIQGADRVAYVEENLGAVKVKLSDADVERIDALNRPGIAAGERYPQAFMDEVNR